MVGIGLLMILIAWSGLWLWWRGRLLEARWYLWPVQHVWWLGFVAVISGWIVTETGRQPWVATGVLRTAEAVSPVAASSVGVTLVLFVLVYGIVFTMGLYYINRLIARGPEEGAIEARDRVMSPSPLQKGRSIFAETAAPSLAPSKFNP
jgi:cytochrome bd ubiquinol oxidase subunit I